MGFCGSFLGVILCAQGGKNHSWGILQSGQGRCGFDNKVIIKSIEPVISGFWGFFGLFLGCFEPTFL